MKHEHYDIESSQDSLRFEFESFSEQKRIRKAIEFTSLPNNSTIYNLGFGDLNKDGTIDDLVVSDNKDMKKVIATVIQSMFKFFEVRPTATILFLGSTDSRTRLYQIVIAQNIDDLNNVVKVRGIRNDDIEDFVKGNKYDAFLINKIN